MIRIIPKLEIKNATVVKGVCLEGIRVVGEPCEMAKRYAADGADELLLIDVVASLYEREPLYGVMDKIADGVFVPLTVGGGLRSIEDMRRALLNGADKVAINTAAVRRPALISEAARVFGSQAVVVSIEAKRHKGGWEVYTDSGRETTGRDAVKWAQEAVELGAGEILLTSIDRDGTGSGLDLALVRAVTGAVGVNVIAGGGVGNTTDVLAGVALAGADGIAVGSALHYGRMTIGQVKQHMQLNGMRVRPAEAA